MSLKSQTWKSNGKLLISGEYLVLEGAKALALPIVRGQSLKVQTTNSGILNWCAKTPAGTWFNASYSLPYLKILSTDDKKIAEKLKNILLSSIKLSGKDFLGDGCDVETVTDFNPEFGFGTSSTLITNIANWACVNPYELLENTFGGSGYDIACSSNSKPLLFQKTADGNCIKNVDFNPVFKDKLYFVYLGNKQSSTSSIIDFRKNCNYSSLDIDTISEITDELVITKDINEFEDLLSEHELIMSSILKLPTVSSSHFNDYPGAVKSLGAWGGDFVLITCHEEETHFKKQMKNLGFNTVFKFEELVF